MFSFLLVTEFQVGLIQDRVFCGTLGMTVSGFNVGEGDNPVSRADFSMSSKLHVAVTNRMHAEPLW